MKRFCLAFVALSCLPAFAVAQAAPQTPAPPAAKPTAAPAGKPAAAPAAPAPPVQNGQTVEEIIARVNNQIVTSSEFQRSKDQLRDEVKQQDAANADKLYPEREKDILRDLIDQQLLLQKGKDLDITGDTELIKWLDQMRKDMKLGSMEELEKAAASQGISYEDFKQNKRNELITQKVIGEEVGSHLSISKDEEQKFYDEHKGDMQQPEQVVLSEILIAPQAATAAPAAKPPAADTSAPNPAGPNAQTQAVPDPAKEVTEADALSAAEAKAKDLLDQIHKGAAFEDIAKKNSNGPTAADGGNLGAFKRGVLAKELEDRTFAMKTGEVTDVIRTKQGFVILKVNEHQEAGVPALKTIEPRIQDALYYQKLQPALRAYLTKLREEAYINIQPGYVDSGASPNETQPIETVAAKESHSRKLKKKKKLGFL